ncbi:phospholipase D-like domain-containing protein [Pedobacter chitinilyticus]|uniref:phospholipase D n=1 Tax=Pedobacter chitinilyticus TaxID=2233776 RepID=A0A3S3PW19_9SPHI|nr:phospholipase D-like domain-containing protein [Pedobacter chitinilyticus]RWU10737.1 hypothetical protein DPV69_05240 [Pedobacter chitinilyticus]
MKLSDLTIESIIEFVSGDNGYTPYLSGTNILKLFNHIGYKDVYKWGDGGMPNSLSRNAYVREKLYEINGTKQMVLLAELVFDPRHFAMDGKKDLKQAVENFNPLILQDGYRLEDTDGRYKVIGADFPDAIEVEVHFEDIQTQIIEQIRSAKFTIWIAVAWFTDRELMKELVSKAREGVNVRLVILDDDINSKYGFPYEKFFETKRVQKTGQYENIMHHKFCIVDFRTVVHGSYNWTVKAKWNKETVSVENSRDLAEKYANEFMQLIK